MSLVESLPHPLRKEHVAQLANHDEVVDVHPEVIGARYPEPGGLVVAVLIRTVDDAYAIVETEDRDGYRVIARGDGAYEELQEWADRRGFE